jgi:phage gpG-like protein
MNPAKPVRIAEHCWWIDGVLIAATEAEVRSVDTVAIVVNDPEASKYAAVHNEGLQAGKGKGFKMPQRQFMPIEGEPFPELEEEVEKFLDAEMDKII